MINHDEDVILFINNVTNVVWINSIIPIDIGVDRKTVEIAVIVIILISNILISLSNLLKI